MGIFSTKNKFKMNALRIKERGSKNTPTNFSEKAVAFMKGMPGYYPQGHELGHIDDPDGIDESKIEDIEVVEGEGGRMLYGKIKGDKKFVGEKDETVYDALQKEIDSGLAKQKYGFEGTDVKEYEKIKLEKMKGPDVKQEVIDVEKEIVDETKGESKKETKEVERTMRFFEGFENTFEIDGTRGDNQVLSIPVKFSGDKVDFTDKSTMDYFLGPGQNMVRGLNDMLGGMREVVKNQILNSMSERDKELLRYGIGDIDTKVNRRLSSILGVGPNDARAYGHKDPLFAIVSMYANKPDELAQVLRDLGLVEKAGTVKEQQEVESSTPDVEGYETEWRKSRG